MEKLDVLREKVIELDRQLLDILNKRGNLVQQIGDEKNNRKLNIHNPIREDQVIKQLKLFNSGPCNPKMIDNIYKEIFKASRELQKQKIKKTLSQNKML
ncbi:TPA: chorismate mutase [Bacillus cereus]